MSEKKTVKSAPKTDAAKNLFVPTLKVMGE